MKASRIVALALCLMLAAMSVVIIICTAQDIVIKIVSAPDSGSETTIDKHPLAPLARAIASLFLALFTIVFIIVSLTGIICALVNIVNPCEIRAVRILSICSLIINSLALLLTITDMIVM